jgi:hypothetical protein
MSTHNIIPNTTSSSSSVGYWKLSETSSINGEYTAYPDNMRRRRIFSFVDDDGMIRMSHNNIHIQPVNNGFLLTMMVDESGVAVYTFTTFESLIKFLSGLTIMDIDSEEIADNV